MADSQSSKSGAKSLTGSPDAKRKAAVILEALCGIRTTESASDELEITMPRYYVLEIRMLQSMIAACEPRARGRQRDADAVITQLRAENERLERDVLRLSALHRITQRAVGVKEDKSLAGRKNGKSVKTQRARRKSRGERVLAALKPEAEATPNAASITVPKQAEPGGT